MRPLTVFAVWFLAAGRCGAQAPPTPIPPAKSPADSLSCFQIRDGFRVELLAAEPVVQDPIAIAWGADGRLWVVEMGGYPTNADGGRIRCLEDPDQDGHYDRSVVFLDGLSFPTGVLPWKRGVLVTCAPHIFYAEDTTGDGRADHRQVVLTGFAEGNPQHRVNGLRFGLDNWIHCSNGDAGGTIGVMDSTDRTLIHGHDFRFCPRRREVQVLSGMSQFGRCRDDWGNWFGCDNLRPFWHVVLEDRYLDRNHMLRDPPTIQHVMEPPTGAVVYPLNRDLARFNEPHLANRFTSACGNAVYRDDLFGPDYADSYFVCEPAHQLVRHEEMVRRGVSFGTRQPEEQRTSEFLASRDIWFRPTQVRTGPDGALWVVDMYRLVIEHPEYMRHNHPQQEALRMGANRGRIYRIVPIASRQRLIPRLDQLDTVGLVAALDTVNGPTRDNVQQRIVERGDRSAVPWLSKLLDVRHRPETRLAALGTLEGLGAATPDNLHLALEDPHPAVRRHAVRVSESLLGQEVSLQRAVLRRVNDVDLGVRLQVACSLGEWRAGESSGDRDRIGQALAQLALASSDQPFIITATLSSSGEHTDAILTRVLAGEQKSEPQVELIKTLLRSALFENQDTTLGIALRTISSCSRGVYQDWQLDVLGDLLDTLTNQGSSLVHVQGAGAPLLAAAISRLDPMFTTARRLVFQAEEPIERRILAARLLGQGLNQQGADRQLLAGLLVPQTPLPIQAAAVESLVRLAHADTPDLLLDRQKGQEPTIRIQVLLALASRTPWAHQLLDRLQSREIPAATITGILRGKLLYHVNSEVRRRAGNLLQQTDHNRQRVIDSFQDSLTMKGALEAGRILFGKHCATCHRYRGEGSEVGPDLATLDDRSPQTLLSSILDPNRSIAPRYVEYHAETTDGRFHSGILKSSSGGTIRLLGPGAKEQVLMRTELDYFESSDRSLMPADWEQLALTRQDFADLIAYLRK